MDINIILLIISLVIIFLSINKTNLEPFNTDISSTKRQIIYNTIPYVVKSPYLYNQLEYWYNPLDYLFNPYVYYTWGGMYGSLSNSYTKSHPGHVHRIRHTRRHSRR
jgi:hypothetical protein